ncbi:NmrA family NAD(P)-binding protein [Nonomuraea fuscirosea]|uniref:NmrA family NAD(P)-binding protein n=1 Tax=Nonomuraea fuscirosea TaxID=1291556 RepID=UPI003448169D
MNSTDRRFLITGATGKTGAASVRLLRERGHAVTALVRGDDARARALADLGADVVIGDLRDFRDVSTAMRGAEGVYLCYPIEPGLVEVTANVAQAAAEAGVDAVVNMSQISARREAKSNAARQHWLAERLLDRSPFRTTHLRPTFFAEWLTWGWHRDGDSGVLALPFGTGHHAPIAGVDQAYVIAAILERPASHDRQIYPLYGPVEMNHYQIAEIMTRVLGIPVRYEPVDVESYQAELLTRGLPQHLVQHFGSVALDYQQGIFAGTNNLVEVIGDHAPMTIEQYVADNRQAFGDAGQFSIRASAA